MSATQSDKTASAVFPARAVTDKERKVICVFGATSDEIDSIFFEAAQQVGRLIARHDYVLIYGGGQYGLIGALAKEVLLCGGTVVGVIPELLDLKGYSYRDINELIVTKDMYERKALLNTRSNAFLALPGGIGTMEEVFEVLTHKHLGFHSKPIVFLNTNGFYDKLFCWIENLICTGFAKSKYRKLFNIVQEPDEIFTLLGRQL